MKRIIITVSTSIFDNYLEERKDIAPHYQALKNKPIYKTFQSEEAAKKFIDRTIDIDKIIRESKLLKLEVSNV